MKMISLQDSWFEDSMKLGSSDPCKAFFFFSRKVCALFLLKLIPLHVISDLETFDKQKSLMFCQKVFTNVIAWASEKAFESTKVLKPEKQESWKNSSWELCLQCNAWWNPRDGEAKLWNNFWLSALHNIFKFSSAHCTKYVFLFLQLYARGTCIFLKSLKVPCLDKKMRAKIMFLYLPPMASPKRFSSRSGIFF